MKNLKNLTIEECIKIASIVEPIKWEFYKSPEKWDGFDLTGKDYVNGNKYIFQIDYRPNIPKEKRFRIYINLYQYPIDNKKIKKILSFLEAINCSPF
jgi:hypothetical protein